MARRASSSTHPLWVVGILILVIGAGVGGYALFQQVSDPYRTIAALDVPAYLENANSLRGNVYKIEGTISDQLAWSPAEGRLLSVEVPDQGESQILPLLVPASFNYLNIQKGQKFLFQIEVGEKGILRARDVRKV